MEETAADGGLAAKVAELEAANGDLRRRLEQRSRRQEALLELGRLAEAGEQPRLLERAAVLLAAGLDCRFAEILERRPEEDRLLLCASAGWQAAPSEGSALPDGPAYQAGYTLAAGEPVKVADLSAERRFAAAPLQAAHGVVSGASVPIGPAGGPRWVLGVYDDRARTFDEEDLGFLQVVAQLLFVALERHDRVAALERAGQRLSFTLDAARMGTWEWHPESDRAGWDARTCALLGLPEGTAASGRKLLEQVHPDDREALRGTLRDAAAAGKVFEIEFRVAGAQGRTRWLSCVGAAFGSDEGAAAHLFGIARDVTERKRAEHEVHELAERRSVALEAAGMGTWEWDVASNRVTLDARARRLLGLREPHQDTARLVELARLLPPEEQRAAVRVLAEARRSGSLAWPEVRVGGGERSGQRWVGIRGRRFGGHHRRDGHIVGVVEDISLLKEEYQRRELLMAELDHRVKNILANVNAIARQTGRRHQNTGEFIATLEGRIRAMADAHSLLSASRWTGANLRTLLASELAPYASQDSEQVRIQGPTLVLAPKAAQSFSLALHELATNAAKHGSLTRRGGRVSAIWELDETGSEPLVRFEWIEHGGAAPAPPTADGFGMTVLKRMVPKDLGADSELSFTADGLSYRIAIPLGQFVAAREAEAAEAAGETGLPGRTAAPAAIREEAAREGGDGDRHPPAADGPRSRKVLIVEDTWAVAEQLRSIIETLGHEPIGPAGSLAEGLALAELPGLEAAILDIHLGEESVFPLAERLAELGIPFGFVSALSDDHALPAAFADRPSIAKPFVHGNIGALIGQLTERPAAG
ncbi:MAG: HWE histidine kinase domain-containing protein [Tistlia sp.]|uniref:HWE histidine kinase domain-containing protein n=1 Tax=Tistlia sp. TaxID=3057121 RepID=UPI0034A44C7C